MKLPLHAHPGCYSRTAYAAGYWAREGYTHGGDPWNTAKPGPGVKHIWVANVMSKLCRSDYDINKEGRCKGCTVEQDVDYFKEMGLI